MKNFSKLGLAALLAFASTGANADLIEYTTEFTLNNTGAYDSGYYEIYDTSNASTIVSLDRFDSSLGTLTDVEVTFSSAFSHYSYAYSYDSYAERYYVSRTCGSWWSGYYECGYYVYNNAVSMGGSATARLTIDLIDPNAGAQTAYDSNTLSCYNGSNNSGISCSNNQYDSNNPFTGTLNTAGISLASFVGNDPIDLRLSNNTTVSGYCGTSYGADYCRASNRSYWGGSVTVSYTYTAVPAPGTLALLGLGLLGLGLVRRRSL